MVNDNWLRDIGQHIAAKIGTALGGSLFLAQVPEDWPSSQVATIVLPRQGGPPDPGGFAYPAIQVVTRAGAFESAWSAAISIRNQLHKQRPSRLGSGPDWTLCTRMSAESEPFLLGRDENHCWLIATNFTLTLQAD